MTAWAGYIAGSHTFVRTACCVVCDFLIRWDNKNRCNALAWVVWHMVVVPEVIPCAVVLESGGRSGVRFCTQDTHELL